MSSKARQLLGELPASEERRYQSSRVSRRSSFNTQPDTSAIHRQPEPTRPAVPEPDEDSDGMRYPHFSILSRPSRFNPAATTGPPPAWRRLSSSTLRSFAPPTIPTYKPRDGSPNYVPHAAFGQKRTAVYNTLPEPPPLPKPLVTAYTSTADTKNGLRKALSKISLKTSRSRSKLIPPFSTPLDRPSTRLSNWTSRPQTSSFTPRTADRRLTEVPPVPAPVRDADATSFLDNDGSSSESEKGTRSRSPLAQGRRNREWFDGMGGTDTESLREDTRKHIRTVPHSRAHTPVRSHHKDGARGWQSQSGPLKVRSQPTSRDLGRQRQPSQTTLRSTVSVVYEQTMMDLSDSDDSGVVVALPSPPRNTKPSQHSRQMSSKGSGDRGAQKKTTAGRPQQFPTSSTRSRSKQSMTHVRAGQGSTTFDEGASDSLPSLAATGSSRPDSFLSSGPLSPEPPLPNFPLPQFVKVPDEGLGSGQATPVDDKEFAESIISELKHGSRVNRIVAAISPEEAILLAKIRRNRADALMKLSMTPPASPAPADLKDIEVGESHATQKNRRILSKPPPRRERPASRASAQPTFPVPNRTSSQRQPAAAANLNRMSMMTQLLAPPKQQQQAIQKVAAGSRIPLATNFTFAPARPKGLERKDLPFRDSRLSMANAIPEDRASDLTEQGAVEHSTVPSPPVADEGPRRTEQPHSTVIETAKVDLPVIEQQKTSQGSEETTGATQQHSASPPVPLAAESEPQTPTLNVPISVKNDDIPDDTTSSSASTTPRTSRRISQLSQLSNESNTTARETRTPSPTDTMTVAYESALSSPQLEAEAAASQADAVNDGKMTKDKMPVDVADGVESISEEPASDKLAAHSARDSDDGTGDAMKAWMALGGGTEAEW